MAAHERKVIRLKKGWASMQTGITKLKNILEGRSEDQFTSGEYISLYTTIYDMCTQKPPDNYSQQLYDKYEETFEDYVENVVLPALIERHDEFMLKELVKRWLNHKVMVRWLSRFFSYLDRYFIDRRSLPCLHNVGIVCFRDQLFTGQKSNVKDTVITLIDSEREGEQIDRALLKHALGIFVEIGMGNMDTYEESFELPMLKDTAAYYSRKAASWIEEDSCPEYMLKAEECLTREKERAGHYLHATSERKLLEKVEEELLAQYENQLLEKEHSGCRALLRGDKLDDLSRMCRLFCRIPKGLEPVAAIFRRHITDEGIALVKEADDAARSEKSERKERKDSDKDPGQAFVRKAIELHDKYMHYVSECFQNHTLFHKALKEAFEVFCQKSIAGSTTAELLATFSDNLLKKGGNEKLSDEEIEGTLENVVRILSYIDDKDLFAEFCRKKLSRRLIQKSSASNDHERSFLVKLKQQYGGQFTSKMQGMMTDMALAEDNEKELEEYLNGYSTLNLGIDLSVTVLTTGFWPSFKSSDFALPAEMVRCVEVFRDFYQAKTQHRRLSWIYSMGTSTISGKFDQRPIELVLTTYQAAVLLLFNAAERLTYADIKGQLNLMDEDVLRVLHSLSCAKYKILHKHPSTKTVSPGDCFEFNAKFTDRQRKVKVPLPYLDEKKKVIEDVDKDRRYAIDASIVRIMKSRKVLNHQQLVSECVEQLKQMFKPDMKVIKKRIEDLISREYLERDKDNPSMFKYLA